MIPKFLHDTMMDLVRNDWSEFFDPSTGEPDAELLVFTALDILNMTPRSESDYRKWVDHARNILLQTLSRNASVRTALSSDPYYRAVERFEDAVCRKGLMKGVQALDLRVRRTSDLGKLQGIDDMLTMLIEDLTTVQKKVRKKIR